MSCLSALRRLSVVAAVLAAFAGQSLQAAQKSPSPRRFEGYPTDLQAKRENYYRHLGNVMSSTGTAGHAPRYVISKLHLWLPGQTVRVAFKGGSDSLRSDIAAAATDWQNYANVTLQFTDPGSGKYYEWSPSDTSYTADIRVSFDKDGYYSLIGAESNTVAPAGEESLNLSGFDTSRPSDWRATTLHEFGHAIGFEHEHQHPTEGCDADFRWDDDPGYVLTTDQNGCWYIADSQGRRPGIYTVLGGCPNNWDKAKVDFNLRQMPASSAFLLGKFDANSIMKYFFESWMFVNGEASQCFSLPNVTLSDQDKVGAATAYPRAPASVTQELIARARLFSTLQYGSGANTSLSKHLKSQLQQLNKNSDVSSSLNTSPVPPLSKMLTQDVAGNGGAAIPRYHADLFDPSNSPMLDLSSSNGIFHNLVDGGVHPPPIPNSPYVLFKGHDNDTWFFAPNIGQLARRADGEPDLTLVAKVKNNADGSRTWVGGTLSFLIKVAQDLPSTDVISTWNAFLRAEGNVPVGNSFNFRPLPLHEGVMNVYGLEGKVVPGGQPLTNVAIGESSAISFAINLTGDAAEQYYKQLKAQNSPPPAVSIICAFKYQSVLPSCQITMSGSKQKTYDYFSTSLKARASYWGLVDASFDRSTVRADLRTNGGFRLEIVGTPPPSINAQKLQDALTDRFLLKEAGDWIKPDPTPVDAAKPGGFFGGVSYAMKEVHFSAEDSFMGTISVSDIVKDPHQISFNFESAFGSLDPAKHAFLIEDDRQLDLKVVMGDCPLVKGSTSIASYTRSGQPVRVQVPDLNSAGGITSGIIQWSAGLEPKPTSAQMETALLFLSPYPSYTLKRTVPITDSGAVLAVFPDNFVQRTNLYFIFDGSSPNNLAIAQWQWTPPPGSPSLPVSQVVRVSGDANELNFPSAMVLFPLREEDVTGGGKLQVKVKGLRGDWAGKETPAFTLTLGQGSLAVDWTGPMDLK
jgi:hypothetical protein